MRTMIFEMITDSRLCDDIHKEIEDRINKVDNILSGMRDKGVRFNRQTKVRVYDDWPDGESQCRVEYRVQKHGRKLTWSDVMVAVNKVKAPYYSWSNNYIEFS